MIITDHDGPGMASVPRSSLFDSLGVSLALQPDGTLEVSFRHSEDTERWRQAPDGYPLDGSRELIRFQGRYFVPSPA